MLTAPSTTIGLAGSARPSLEIDYALPGDHLPVQQHRVEQLAVLRKKHAKPRLDEYSKRVIPKTAAARRRAIEECADYFERTAHIDHKQIWYGLCVDDTVAVRHCQDFLEDYVSNAKRRVVLSGEYMDREEVRSITSAKTLLLFWDVLVGEANSTILQEKRDEDPRNRSKWVLVNSGKRTTAGYAGPVSRIRKWIQDTLAPDLGLSLQQTFHKKESTPDDVILVINMIWKRPRDIPCDQRLRVAFHSTVLIGALGGFRPGVIECLKYKDIEVAMIRGPESPVLVATTKLTHNKQRTGTCASAQNEFIDFSVTFVPEKRVCLLSLIIAQALADQAFDPGFQSFEEVLTRPKFEDGIDYIPLRWKEEMLGEPIFPIDYNRYASLWNRAWLVSGARDEVRPYSMRVGAGARIDASASNALRNYILSNTSRVFERSYIPRQVRIDLLKTNFAAGGTAKHSDQIFELLRRASLKSDPNAPLYATREDYEKMEQGQCLRNLRAAHEKLRKTASANSPEVKRAVALIHGHIKRATGAIVKKKRIEYFKQVDRLRALGRSAVELESGSEEVIPENKCCSLVASTAIAKFLERPELGGKKRQHYYVEILCAHLTLRPASVEHLVRALSTDGDDEDNKIPVHDVRPEPYVHGNPTRCLLGCEQSFSRRSALTKHFLRVHGATFRLQFECPECCRLGIRPAALIGSVMEWSNHVEMFHGKGFAPTMDADRATQITERKPRKHLPKQLARCLICNAHFCSGSGFSRHFRNRHVGTDFSAPLPCPECHRRGSSDIVWVQGLEEWLHHARVVHSFDSERGISLSQDGPAPELLHIPKDSRAKQSWGKAKRRPPTSSEQDERLERKRRQQRSYKERRRLRENAIKATGSESDYASEACESAPQTRWRSHSVASIEAWGDCDETPECGDEYAEDGDDLFNPGGIFAEPDSDILFEDAAISYPEIDLPESISFDDDFPGMSNDIDASQTSSEVQSLTFDGVDYDLDFDDIFRNSNAFEEPTNHGGLMPQTSTCLEVVLTPIDPDLYQAFDKDVHRYGHGDSVSDDQPYDAISSMFPMERGQEMSSEQVAGCATGGPKPDAATVATSDVSQDVQPFTAPHRSQRSIPASFSLREL